MNFRKVAVVAYILLITRFLCHMLLGFFTTLNYGLALIAFVWLVMVILPVGLLVILLGSDRCVSQIPFIIRTGLAAWNIVLAATFASPALAGGLDCSGLPGVMHGILTISGERYTASQQCWNASRIKREYPAGTARVGRLWGIIAPPQDILVG